MGQNRKKAKYKSGVEDNVTADSASSKKIIYLHLSYNSFLFLLNRQFSNLIVFYNYCNLEMTIKNC